LMTLSEVKAVAYSSIANLGPGFDVFGIAVDFGRDILVARKAKGGIRIEIKDDGFESIPREVERNTAGLVSKRVLEDFQVSVGLELEIWKGIRPKKGLGSSSASASAAIVALNSLLDLNLSDAELVRYASLGEEASAGAPHADNVAASLLGGLTIVKSYHPLSVLRVEPPKDLVLSIVVPEIEVDTKSARSILPEVVTIKDLVHNVGHASSLVFGAVMGDIDLMGRSMEDVVVEPSRAKLIPGYNLVKRYAMEAGASGVAISGSGPSMVAIVDPRKADPGHVSRQMEKAFMEAGVEAEARVVKPAPGARVLEVE
jgi:homoserine kinase